MYNIGNYPSTYNTQVWSSTEDSADTNRAYRINLTPGSGGSVVSDPKTTHRRAVCVS